MAYVSIIGSAEITRCIARGLGWFSVGLGLIELSAPSRLGSFLGLERQKTLLQAHGVRELLAGLGLLFAATPSTWLWARVAGDALDLATLAPGLRESNRQRMVAASAAAAVAAITLLDIYCAVQTAEQGPEIKAALNSRRGSPATPDTRLATAA
jgi:hypothetical protein